MLNKVSLNQSTFYTLLKCLYSTNSKGIEHILLIKDSGSYMKVLRATFLSNYEAKLTACTRTNQGHMLSTPLPSLHRTWVQAGTCYWQDVEWTSVGLTTILWLDSILFNKILEYRLYSALFPGSPHVWTENNLLLLSLWQGTESWVGPGNTARLY